jgi:OmpA-OmpF porin, OOP family
MGEKGETRMADSMFASLLHKLDRGGVCDVARALGESEQAVSRGMESSIAVVLGSMAGKSEEPDTLRKLLDLVPGSGEFSCTNLANGLSNPSSPLLAEGKRLLAGLFGDGEITVMNAVSRESGLTSGATSALLAVSAPLVMNSLGKRVRDEGMTMSGLGSLLQRDSASIRSALPSGLSDLFWPRTAADAASPVVGRAVNRASSFPGLVAAIALAALVLGLGWLFTHTRRPVPQTGSVSTGEASRLATGVSGLGDFVKRKLPNNVELNIPGSGVESRLLVFIEDPKAGLEEVGWFDFDRLLFDRGSATLRPESQEQLNNIAAILSAYPNVHLKIGGYTDDVGDSGSNLELSQERANRIKTELVARGISPDRLTAEGYGEQSPVANNSTESGRARNRRVSMRVMQK